MNPQRDQPFRAGNAPDESSWIALLAILTLAIVAVKVPLIWRININWDEFYYLSNIYKSARNEVTGVFQYGYVHLFDWLTAIGGDEVDQVIAGRLVMVVLLAVTAVLIARIAAHWTSWSSAWLAPLCFLSVSHVTQHGASFRADSLLAPLTLLTLLALLSARSRARDYLLSGLFLGLSLVVSLKAVLLGPLFLALILTSPAATVTSGTGLAWIRFVRLLQFGIAASVTAGVLLYLHSLTLPQVESGAIGEFAAGAARTTLLENPLMPRAGYFLAMLATDRASWVFVVVGTAIAVAERSRAALCVLSLLPILFYRNAYPYYYVVMLAPAAVLTAVGVHNVRQILGRKAPRVARWIPAIVGIPLLLQAGVNIKDMMADEQANQRRTIAAAHEIFPEPVPYIDHAGMLASYPKVNFFMSTWGVDSYRRREIGFMQRAIDEHRPPLLLADTATLWPGTPNFQRLLPEDQFLIEKYYLPYWGRIRVAGGSLDLAPESTGRLEVPFPGRYRLESGQAVVVGGTVYRDGDIIALETASAAASLSPGTTGPTSIRVIHAGARPPPVPELSRGARLYSNL